ncbi:putative transcriptional acitvator, Baf family [[Leptolyngbya] sp. PCC 7376]|uniref:pantothenate kinase n=1 Tax=[Leptolyngbya] sp. PCC 7376 TaxID=111781 RepID=UPI00029EE20F|nr:pantothenate kinase [[Leptolyngbya] sp. PCC 7376]AFY37147.1 putative transcriptional acitvator, Baf family [[Leptolyngbya] sp. PCC 7376]
MTNENLTALMIGNSRYHWAEILDGRIQRVWHTSHNETLPNLDSPLVFASVVPAQGDRLKRHYPTATKITLADIPLGNLYPTLGIDRALAMYGAGEIYGYPCLVIDGGTALTFSGVDGDRRFVGGAILPGLRLQFQMLPQGTAALPSIELPEQLPTRWAQETKEAIASGILHTVSAGLNSFIDNWLTKYPTSSILVTGGDGNFLKQSVPHPELVHIDADLVLQGLVKLWLTQKWVKKKEKDL